MKGRASNIKCSFLYIETVQYIRVYYFKKGYNMDKNNDFSLEAIACLFFTTGIMTSFSLSSIKTW